MPLRSASRGEVEMARLFIIISLLCAGCAGNPTTPGRGGFDEPFELRAGASVGLAEALTLIFDRVASDSRCPIDALCITNGDAVVAVTISQGAAGAGRRELHTEPPSEALYLNYSVKLLELQPYPQSGRQARPEDYVATFIVARR
jgi:hypothetical protein